MEGLVWLGLITCIAATLITALGLIVQKHSHNAREGDLPLYRRWRWWIGFGLLVICGGFFDSLVPQLLLSPLALMLFDCVQALSLAPLSILAPLSGLTIMANVVLANIFLGEPVERIELASTAVIMLGLCFTSVFGSHASPNYDVKSLLELWYPFIHVSHTPSL